MQPYIVVGLRGGLGNQLFQYASGYGIARRLGAELYFDRTRLPDDEHNLPGLLGSQYRDASRTQLMRLGIIYNSDGVRGAILRSGLRHVVDAGRRLRHLTPTSLPVDHRVDSAGRYDEGIFSMDLPMYLLGWWQTDRYFAHVADDVVHQLRLPQVTLPPRLQTQPVVALSFRRGDYVRNGWQLPFSYYERALPLMKREVPDATFLVFGDDPEFVHLAIAWVSRYGPAVSAYEFVRSPIDQLVLASECDHAVIANSSFTWWSAWLGDQRVGNAPRVVIAPEAYRTLFGPDILPDNWIAVPS